MEPIRDERELAAICAALGARHVAGFTAHEAALVTRALPATRAGAGRATTVTATRAAGAIDPGQLEAIRAAVRQGHDPLGEAFCALRPPAARRPLGATYTPPVMVDAIVAWAREEMASVPGRPRTPARIVDPGTGSGRFLVAAGRAFPHARLIGVEIDPLAALTARASLAASGMAGRSSVVVADYREVALAGAGPTLFLGNPPYVRHHDIPACWKAWLADTARGHGLAASGLAGLHVHFFLATLVHARPGDAGAFVTAAEWLDVNYGQLARDLVAGPLGGLRIDVFAPTVQPFPDAQSTAAITCFRVGARTPSLHLRRVATLAALAPLRRGRQVSRRLLATSERWTPLLSGPGKPAPRSGALLAAGELPVAGELIELGELCRVHRGQVTGKNEIWIAGPDTPWLPESVLLPAVTRARELFAAGDALADDSRLRRVIDLPPDFGRMSIPERRAVQRFLDWARARGGDASYVARHRSPWWSVRLREPPPILATYMARRPPAFVRNRVGARYLNIAHGLYPRAPLSETCLDALSAYLAGNVGAGQGRTYAGGLIKFEPGEMERILVPRPETLERVAGQNMQPVIFSPCGIGRPV